MEGLVSSYSVFARRLLRSLILTAIALFISAGHAYAYRPLQTEDAYVAGKGIALTELSWDYLNWKNGDVANVFLAIPKFGATDTLELSVELPYVYFKPKNEKSAHGLSDVNLSAKQAMIKESGWFPQLTVKGVIKLDNGDPAKGLGTGDIDYSLFLVASKAIGPFTFNGQIGHTWIGNKEDGNLRNIALWGCAADYSITETLHAVAEIYGNKNPDRRLADLDNVLTGVYYNLTKKLTIDASLRTGLNSASLNWGGGMGLSYQFN